MCSTVWRLVDYGSATANLRNDLVAGTATASSASAATLITLQSNMRGGNANDTIFAPAQSFQVVLIVKSAGMVNVATASLAGGCRDANPSPTSTIVNPVAIVKAVGGNTLTLQLHNRCSSCSRYRRTAWFDNKFALLTSAGTVIGSNDDGAAFDAARPPVLTQRLHKR
jgi:hypothetical protein